MDPDRLRHPKSEEKKVKSDKRLQQRLRVCIRSAEPTRVSGTNGTRGGLLPLLRELKRWCSEDRTPEEADQTRILPSEYQSEFEAMFSSFR